MLQYPAGEMKIEGIGDLEIARIGSNQTRFQTGRFDGPRLIADPEISGQRHPDTVTTRQLRAWMLQDLGGYNEALAEVSEKDLARLKLAAADPAVLDEYAAAGPAMA